MLRPLRPVAFILLIATLVGAAVWAVSARHLTQPASPPDLNAALSAIRANDLDRGRELLDAFLKESPDNPEALLYSGQLRRDSGDLEGALGDWRRVADEPPQFALASGLSSRTTPRRRPA